MNKSHLVSQLAVRLGITQAQAATMVEHTLDIIVRSVAEGDAVTIMGFGTFDAKDRAARRARNPHTGAEISVPAIRTPTFRPAKYFRTVVADGEIPHTCGHTVRRSSSHGSFGG
ncbi:HU family DNA-binding protein [Corynebacterium sp. TAE3-ERU12]|uniref:HU family DNA-binding protein n=1 Tax=Corynebacterium sp. TAE3-ERU12 TaxID=2849491 RepID=UPI001C492CA3|nr:HU family DNA-binding protein [Corynebacterium sp. TAE3-ERU12]